MANGTPTDDELLRDLAAGDEDAFLTLYRRWQGPVFRFALQMSGSRAVADDVTQETFLVLMRDSRGYRAARGTVGAYLYGIARHITLRSLRRSERSIAVEEEMLANVAEAADLATADPYQQSVRSQRSERLWAAVLALPVHYREVIVLCELHEMDYAAAAALLGCSIGTVRSRLHRARAILTERLRSAGLAPNPIAAVPDGSGI
jgi:RNA polymerase sigma-70 factor, ECF subfamily